MSSFALRFFWRDWRSGELSILTLSLIVAISTMTSIGLFTDRIKLSIYEQASHVLAADAQVRGNSPVKPAWVEKAQALGLNTANTVSISVMAFAGDAMRLSAVKAVTDGYPLKGVLEVSDVPYAEGNVVQHGPPAGEVWINSSLFSALNITLGDNIEIGEKSLRVSAALIKEPDVNMGSLFSGTRILMHADDLAETQTVQFGSRVRYHWLLEGDDEKIEEFKQWLEPELDVHHWWKSALSSSERMSETMNRAQSFLMLAGSLSVILAGIAVALAARRYAYRQKKSVALLKTLGLTPKKITRIYSVYLVLLGAIAAVIGMSLGYVLHLGILLLLQDMLPVGLAAPSAKSYWSGGVAGFVALVAFAGPPLMVLRNIPPIVVIRDLDVNGKRSLLVSGLIGLAAIVGLVLWYSQSFMITAVLFAALFACLLGVAVLAVLFVNFARFIGKSSSGFWRLGFTNLHRHRQYNIFQIMIFTILLMLLFVLVLTRTSLIQNWQAQTPVDAPNYFIYNIFDDEKLPLENYFHTNNVDTEHFYPLMQGRITAYHGNEFKREKGDPHDRNRYARELGLTWSDTLAQNNEVVAGRWWNEIPKAEVLAKGDLYLASIEKTFSEDMGLEVGDQIIMSIAGTEITTEVASIRTLEWNSRSPNFYMIFNRPILDGVGANWMTSFYLPNDKVKFTHQLMNIFPTVTLLGIEQLIQQIDEVISQVSLAVEFILLLVLIAGLLVLVTGIQATLDERLKESAILRTLGASRALVQRSLLVEFSGLGFVAGFLATIGAQVCLYFLQTTIFDMTFEPVWLLFLVGPVLSVVLIAFIGWLSTKKVTSTPPLVILRGLDGSH